MVRECCSFGTLLDRARNLCLLVRPETIRGRFIKTTLPHELLAQAMPVVGSALCSTAHVISAYSCFLRLFAVVLSKRPYHMSFSRRRCLLLVRHSARPRT